MRASGPPSGGDADGPAALELLRAYSVASGASSDDNGPPQAAGAHTVDVATPAQDDAPGGEAQESAGQQGEPETGRGSASSSGEVESSSSSSGRSTSGPGGGSKQEQSSGGTRAARQAGSEAAADAPADDSAACGSSERGSSDAGGGASSGGGANEPAVHGPEPAPAEAGAAPAAASSGSDGGENGGWGGASGSNAAGAHAPPEEARDVIDKLVAFVQRSGPAFEVRWLRACRKAAA